MFIKTRLECLSGKYFVLFQLEDPQKMVEFSSVFCSLGILPELQRYFQINAQVVSELVCSMSPNSWYSELPKYALPRDVFTNYVSIQLYLNTFNLKYNETRLLWTAIKFYCNS